MTTNEFYYLILVAGAFGSLAVSLLAATLQYRAWLRRPGRTAAARPVRRLAARPILDGAA